MTMTETAIQPIDIMLVLPGDELWGAEQLRADLAAAGLRLMAEEEFRSGGQNSHRKPAAILAFLSGRLEPDVAVCRKWVDLGLGPVIAVSQLNSEDYVLALFAAGVEDIVQRPIKSHELAARIRSILRRLQPALIKTQPRSFLPGLPGASISLPVQKPSRIRWFLSGFHRFLTPKHKTP